MMHSLSSEPEVFTKKAQSLGLSSLPKIIQILESAILNDGIIAQSERKNFVTHQGD